MKLPAYKRIYTNDYSEQNKQLVDQLSFPINNGIESLYQLTNNSINLRDNAAATVTDNLVVTVDANGIPTSSVTYPLKLTTAVDGIQVISAVSNQASGAPVYPTSGVFVTGTTNQGKMVVNHVAGLPANISFTLRLVTYQN